jgi:hypothetical protein
MRSIVMSVCAAAVAQENVQGLRQEIDRSLSKWQQKQSFNGGRSAQEQNNEADDEDRSHLLLSKWKKLPLPPRDFLLGDLLCTTSRWLVVGETGIGKTLLHLSSWHARRAALSDGMANEKFAQCSSMINAGETFRNGWN